MAGMPCSEPSPRVSATCGVYTAHTHQQGIKQHIRCVPALREERGVWVWVVGDGTCAVLGRSHYRHHRAMGCGCDWMGLDGVREREDEANGPNTRDVEGSAPQ